MLAPLLIASLLSDVAVPKDLSWSRDSSPQIAVITRSASTNRAGFSLVVRPTGAVTARLGTLTQVVHVGTGLVKQLYADLDRAGELDRLPAGHCLKSASFGTTTSIAYKGWSSPDLQCAQNSAERALQSDVDAISTQALKGMPQRRRTLPVFIRPASPNM
jgi:hypothetical protein